MEATRSKVVAAAASIVPFHCVICFDEFNLKERTPMVLPCGHTFVCAQCTKRLRRCMECREPLFLTGYTHAPNNPRQSTSSNYNGRIMGAGGTAGGRYSPSCQLTLSPQPTNVHGEQSTITAAPAPIPLPIPKNVVLISLMEAAERQQLDLRKTQDSSDLEVELEDEEFDLDRIISGMATFSGPCGTYSVAAEEGVLVQPNDPRHEEEKKMCGDSSDSGDEIASTGTEHQEGPFTLQKGQTVQVVSFEDGVAKLARGAGYIVASSSQLVKVNGPMETVCRLEGLLDTIKARGSDLQSTLDENRQIESSLRNQIEAEMKLEPNHPVISKPPESDFWFKDVHDKAHNTDSTSGPSTPTAATENPPLFPRTPDKSPRRAGASSLPGSCDSTDGAVNHRQRSPVSIDNADLQRGNIPGYRRTVSEDDLDHLVFGCGAAFLGHGTTGLFGAPNILAAFESADHQRHNNDLTRLSRSSTDQQNQYHCHDYATPTLTSSFDGINFRTGMSGHRGLSNTAVKASGNSPTPRYRQMRMMSEHRGVAPLRGPPNRRGGNPSNNSPTSTPTFGPRFSPYPFSSGEETP